VSFIDLSKNEVHCKIVFYGPGRGGKTTNLLYLHRSMVESARGKMVSIATKTDRTLFFDFLPLSLGTIRNLSIRIQLYTVPGQVMYDSTRKLVLKGVDGVVFVADSLAVQREKNLESLENLRENLRGENTTLEDIPLVFQFNKRDLVGSGILTLPVEDLEESLNRGLGAPCFSASATQGDGVFETLRAISKLTVKSVTRKLLCRQPSRA
jgi:signal recognition particle receptor subunit beta